MTEKTEVATPSFEAVVSEVQAIQSDLEAAGWQIANAVGEQVSPDRKVWFSAGYVFGEYTVTASYRPRGAGPAQGSTRVRLTPSLVQAHPGIGRTLARDLVSTAEEARRLEATGKGTIEDVLWPPAYWGDLAR